MDILKFKEWQKTEDYRKLNSNSIILLYKNSFGKKLNKFSRWEWGIWSDRDVWDSLFQSNQMEYPELGIKRMKVQDILDQDSPEYSTVKEDILKKLEEKMEYIKTFEQYSNSELLLEKIDYNKIDEYVKKIASNPKIFTILNKLKKYLTPLYNNYTKNGVIQSDKLFNDIKTLSLNTSEKFDFYDTRNEYDYETGRYVEVKENKILRILVKIIKAPYELVKWLWDEIVDSYKDSFFMGTLLSITVLITAAFIVLIGIMIYLFIDHLKNKFEIGVVANKEITFVPAHINLIPVTTSNGKTTTTILVPVHIPNTWSVDVKDINSERVEVWSTSEKSYVEGIGLGDTLYLTNFSFSGKVKSGK